MRCVFLLAVMVGVTWGRPSDTLQLSSTPPTRTHPTPVLIKDIGNLTIHVSHSKGDYELEVFRQNEDAKDRVSTKLWALPNGWRPPGLELARIVHSEVLSTGDIIVAFFSLETGLDLILLPKELFVYEETESGIIVFPELKEPWHPTVSTPTEPWKWPDTTTPYSVPPPEAE